MNKEFKINNQELLEDNLIALAITCIDNDTDSCNLTISTEKGEIICHIKFEGKLKLDNVD